MDSLGQSIQPFGEKFGFDTDIFNYSEVFDTAQLTAFLARYSLTRDSFNSLYKKDVANNPVAKITFAIVLLRLNTPITIRRAFKLFNEVYKEQQQDVYSIETYNRYFYAQLAQIFIFIMASAYPQYAQRGDFLKTIADNLKHSGIDAATIHRLLEHTRLSTQYTISTSEQGMSVVVHVQQIETIKYYEPPAVVQPKPAAVKPLRIEKQTRSRDCGEGRHETETAATAPQVGDMAAMTTVAVTRTEPVSSPEAGSMERIVNGADGVQERRGLQTSLPEITTPCDSKQPDTRSQQRSPDTKSSSPQQRTCLVSAGPAVGRGRGRVPAPAPAPAQYQGRRPPGVGRAGNGRETVPSLFGPRPDRAVHQPPLPMLPPRPCGSYTSYASTLPPGPAVSPTVQGPMAVYFWQLVETSNQWRQTADGYRQELARIQQESIEANRLSVIKDVLHTLLASERFIDYGPYLPHMISLCIKSLSLSAHYALITQHPDGQKMFQASVQQYDARILFQLIGFMSDYMTPEKESKLLARPNAASPARSVDQRPVFLLCLCALRSFAKNQVTSPSVDTETVNFVELGAKIDLIFERIHRILAREMAQPRAGMRDGVHPTAFFTTVSALYTKAQAVVTVAPEDPLLISQQQRAAIS